jgi:hypothetical protein
MLGDLPGTLRANMRAHAIVATPVACATWPERRVGRVGRGEKAEVETGGKPGKAVHDVPCASCSILSIEECLGVWRTFVDRLVRMSESTDLFETPLCLQVA